MRAEHLYVHVPFCGRRCVYCDFSIAVRARVPEREYLEAFARELERHARSTLDLRTVYLGGGTPSKLSPTGIETLLGMIVARAMLASDAEITIEANPEDVTAEVAQRWRRAGVNRVSLGVQSFQPEVLAWMHRTHTTSQALDAIDTLRGAGIENVSLDLIFAVPATLHRAWRQDVEQAIALDVPHVSVYGLTVEPRTPLGRWVARQQVMESPEEAFEEEFLASSVALTAAGLAHYEVSNFARPGYESRHNSAYWVRKPYAGLGPSAHEFDGVKRRWNVAAYVAWKERLRRGHDPLEASEVLTPASVAAEEVYLGLRTRGGLGLRGEDHRAIERWTAAGWGEVDNGRLRLTPAGWLRLDTLAADLTHLRSRY